MQNVKIRVVLDTNTIISAVIFGGNPRQVLDRTVKKEIIGITSKIISAEISEIFSKKFPDYFEISSLVESKMEKTFETVIPSKTIFVCRDPDDNRVLEAGVEGSCDFIITGDKDLLELKSYKGIKIVTPGTLLSLLLK